MHRRLREISSVVMTTSGFLSPSREGKLPESRLMPFPNFKTNSSQPSTSYSTVPPEVKGEQHQQQRMKQQNRKQSQKILNSFKEKGKNAIESNNNNNKNEGVKVKKLTSMKETSKLKALKTGAIRESNQGPRLKKTQKIKDKSKLNLLNTIFDKPVQASSSHLKYSKNSEGDNEKLTTEPDKQKLNIFKKISKVKEDKNNESSGHQSSKSNMPITSKANSTIVSSDILIKPELKPEVIEEKPLKPIFTKPPIEKKNDSVQKTPVKNTKQELNTNTPKKRKKKPKILNDDYDPPTIDPISSNTGTKKSKNKHDSNLFSSPLKFSFFGHLPTGPGLLPTGPSILPPSLASNPLVPKYTPPNNVIPMLEKPSSTTSMIYLPLPGEDHFEKPELDELSSEKEKVQTEKIKVNYIC
jgi:transcription initiation factor TFIID subunit 3